jgi:uncharacterized protein YbjT (DUF2867 family)
VILIAGGSGRLGTILTDRLVERGLPVRILTRDPDSMTGRAQRGIEVAGGDVRDPSSLEAAAGDVDVVVSAVHGFVGPRGISPASVDRDGNINLTDMAKAAGADLVMLSIVGTSPDSPLELSRMKEAAEQYALSSGVPTTIVRATAYLDLWVEVLKQTAQRSGRPLVFGRGDNPINFVAVRDVAALVERVVIDPSTRGRTLEIGGPENLTFNQLATAVQKTSGRDSTARHVPVPILRMMALTMGRVKPQLGRQARAALTMDRYNFTFDATGIRTEFPDLPCTSLADLLATT